MAWEIDIGTKTPEQMEKDSSQIPAGFYWATLTESEDREDGDIWLHFQISKGDHQGRKLMVFLKNPDMESEEKKIKGAKTRATTFANRLGAVAPNATGVVTVNFDLAVTKEFIVRIVNEEYKGKTDSRIEYFAGVYPAVGHLDIPNDDLVKLGLPPRPEVEKKGKGKKGKEGAADSGAGSGNGAAGGGAGAAKTAADKVW